MNLITPVASNILTHLKKGFFEWLLGVLPPGLVMPEKWDLAGIFHFVMQFFDLTWQAIKAKVAKLVGQPVADVLETAFDIFQTIKKDGIIGLWNYVKEKVGDLKTMVIDALMGMLQNQVVQAGITWLLGLLTPAGAFIKACQAIYGIVMWFVNNAKRIMDLINSIIDSTALIVAGKLDSAADMVENAMAKIIPIAIGFLAGGERYFDSKSFKK